jgi:hypothetical protein
VAASVITLGGCVSSPRPDAEPDSICSEIADFANASTDGLLHKVTLINDWGGVECSSNAEGEIYMYCKTCTHDKYGPGKQLCEYLMQHTSTEFSQLNFTRALGCLGGKFKGLAPGRRADSMANKPIWSSHVSSVRRGISVGLEYFSGDESKLPVLIIFAQRRRAS